MRSSAVVLPTLLSTLLCIAFLSSMALSAQPASHHRLNLGFRRMHYSNNSFDSLSVRARTDPDPKTFQAEFEGQLDEYISSRSIGVEEGAWVAGRILSLLEGRGWTPEPAPRDTTGCTWALLRYVSSPLEQYWMDNVFRLYDYAPHAAFCMEIGRQTDDFVFWIRSIHRASITTKADPELDRVFSRFLYLESCPGLEPREVVSYIEPLAGPLRHPLSVCTDMLREDLWNELRVSKDYLVLPSSASPELGPLFDRSLRAQSLLLDAGASTWTPPSYDIGGASMSWFWNKFVPRGLPLDRILAWEITPHNDSMIYEGVPDEALPVLQYMNVGVDNATDSPRNPLEIIRRIGRKEDYITFKLDIDCPMEEYLVDQLASDSHLLSLVDEFFYESHGNFSAAKGVWGPRYGEEGQEASRYRLSDIYVLLGQMRHRGIRSHGWP